MKRVLEFLRLTDANNNLSLSNITVMVLIGKIVAAGVIDWVSISGLMVAMLNYSHKRHEATKKEEPNTDTEALVSAIDELKAELKAVKYTADDAKEKASRVALASGISTKKYGRDER